MYTETFNNTVWSVYRDICWGICSYLPSFLLQFWWYPVFQTVWAQAIGTVIIGGLVANKEKIQQSYGVLYISLSTGLCGSLTTFSSRNAEAAEVLLQLNETSLKPTKHPLYVSHVVAFITVLLLGIGMSVAAFQFGKHLASLITFRPCYKLRWQCHLISCVCVVTHTDTHKHHIDRQTHIICNMK